MADNPLADINIDQSPTDAGNSAPPPSTPSSSSVQKVKESKDGGRRVKVTTKSKRSTKRLKTASVPELSPSTLHTLNSKLDILMDLVPDIKAMREAFYNDDDSEGESPHTVPVEEPTISSHHEDEEEGEIIEESDDLKYFINMSGTTVKTGPIINSNIAKGVNQVLEEGLSTSARDKIHETYDTPSNCKRMSVITCNPEIYKSSSKPTRVTDSNLQTFKEK